MSIYLPYYAKQGCQKLEDFTEEFESELGHKATLIKIRYLDSKGRENIAIKQVIWKDQTYQKA